MSNETNHEDSTVKSAFLSITEAAQKLGVHPNTLRAACSRSEFPHIRFGRAIRISTAKLDEIIANGTV